MAAGSSACRRSVATRGPCRPVAGSTFTTRSGPTASSGPRASPAPRASPSECQTTPRSTRSRGRSSISRASVLPRSIAGPSHWLPSALPASGPSASISSHRPIRRGWRASSPSATPGPMPSTASSTSERSTSCTTPAGSASRSTATTPQPTSPRFSKRSPLRSPRSDPAHASGSAHRTRAAQHSAREREAAAGKPKTRRRAGRCPTTLQTDRDGHRGARVPGGRREARREPTARS